MIGWTSIREFYSHLKEANYDFDHHVVTGQILSAFFKGEESVFPHPDDGTESKAPFRIANWETIGAPSPELKSFLDAYKHETNKSLTEYEKSNYKHHGYYYKNRSSLFESLPSIDNNEKERIFSSLNPAWVCVAQKFYEANYPHEITAYFINTIDIRNATAYAAINHFGWGIPSTWIESFRIDLKAIGKPGPKTDQVKAIPGIWLRTLIENGWHSPTQKGLPTAATLIHHLFCPDLKLDSIRKSIGKDYEDILAEQDRKIVLHTNTIIG